MEIIALSGYARSGKDEAAKVLVEEFGFTRVAFADKLRDVLYALNPVIKEKSWAYECKDAPYCGPHTKSETVYLQDVIDTYTWDKYKETEYGAEIRRLLQRLGTEAGRQTLWDSIWIDAALTGFSDDAKIVVTDCRFVNEAQAIKERGGQIWRITRPGIGPATGSDGSIHPSETSLDDWAFDLNIGNYGPLSVYREAVAFAYKMNKSVEVMKL